MAYAEVTGYCVPTLYQWVDVDTARAYTRWLLSVQLPSGAFPVPDGVPYTFDTGQIMRGLCAALNWITIPRVNHVLPELRAAGCDSGRPPTGANDSLIAAP